MLGFRYCAGFSLVSESRGYSLVAVHRLLTVVASMVAKHDLSDLWASGAAAYRPSSVLPVLQSTGSTAVMHGLSCPAACGIFLDQGLNLHILHWQTVFITEPPGKPPRFFFKKNSFLSVQITYSFLNIVGNVCWWNSLYFPLSENVLISPSFSKGIFTGYRILGWQLISLRT